MIVAIVRNQSCSIRSRGSALEDRNRSTKNSGKTPCTASPEPDRSPTNAPERGERERDQQRQHKQHGDAGRPAAKCRPAANPTAR